MDVEKGKVTFSNPCSGMTSTETVNKAGNLTPDPTPCHCVRFVSHFSGEISSRHADIILLLCTLISGLVDSAMFDAYNTFVSMQTGNTIFLGLGASQQNTTSDGWARCLVAIFSFMLGCIFFSRLNQFCGGLRRLTISFSFLLQAACVFIAAGVIQGGFISGDTPSHPQNAAWTDLAPIGVLAFQSAGQIVASRALAYGELPTVVVTSLLCDLWSDPALLRPLGVNPKRNRRALGFILALAGAIAGGWLCRATQNIKAVLWIVGSLKVCIVVAWLCWAKKGAKP